jgi:DNA-binding MarR family transcriptional regulator
MKRAVISAKDAAPVSDPPPRREPRMSYLIKRVQYAVYLKLEERLAAFGLTAEQYAVFSIVGHRDGLSSAQLARRFAVTPQTMIKLIATLEDQGLIRRTVDDANRRALKVTLTERGRRQLVACEAEVDKLEATIFGGFITADMQQFRALLARVLANTQPVSVSTPPPAGRRKRSRP